jgi:ferritin-like metal-binding protein YciE
LLPSVRLLEAASLWTNLREEAITDAGNSAAQWPKAQGPSSVAHNSVKSGHHQIQNRPTRSHQHRNFPTWCGVAPSHGQCVQETPMAKKEKMLEDLFHETLKDIYYAEKKILTALPKMAKAAQSEDLQAAFEKHEGETTDQVERLEQIFELMKHPAKGKTCDAINGMIDESQQVMKEFKGSAALDAGLIASAQAVEHYEISRYGTLKAWAEQLGLQQAVTLLDETLEEEKKTDEGLTELAKAAVNQEAQQAAE